MLSSLLLASTDPSNGLSVDNPLVLGPIAAFIFTIFVMEIVVPGKAYRREVEENKRLREVVEKVVPLAEAMVVTSGDMIDAMKDNTQAYDRLVDFFDDETGSTKWRRK